MAPETEPDQPASPSIVGELTDDARPEGTGLAAPGSFNVETHNAKTRRTIAYFTLGLLGVLYLIGVIAWVTHLLSGDDAARLMFALSGVQTLGATIVGYYFAKEG